MDTSQTEEHDKSIEVFFFSCSQMHNLKLDLRLCSTKFF